MTTKLTSKLIFGTTNEGSIPFYTALVGRSTLSAMHLDTTSLDIGFKAALKAILFLESGYINQQIDYDLGNLICRAEYYSDALITANRLEHTETISEIIYEVCLQFYVQRNKAQYRYTHQILNEQIVDVNSL